jgi:hypothetical protein
MAAASSRRFIVIDSVCPTLRMSRGASASVPHRRLHRGVRPQFQYPPPARSMSDANASLVHNPQRSSERMRLQQRYQASHQREDRVDLLVPRPEHHNAVVLRRWVRPKVPKPAIQRQNRPSLGLTDSRNGWISGAAEPFLKSSGHVVPRHP